jgi:hypothetical protein
MNRLCDKLAKLLEKNIEASNRTTHAVRAFVRFLFIQLSFLTAAAVLWQLGLAFPDENNCTAFGCQPNWFVSLLVAGLVIAGVLISSSVGWAELSLSDPRGTLEVELLEERSRADASGKYKFANKTTNVKEYEGRICPSCSRVYPTELKCDYCDRWL